ncbi:MAG: hypothetical protein Kow0069_10920 [Promethearchaeota archaeon]
MTKFTMAKSIASIKTGVRDQRRAKLGILLATACFFLWGMMLAPELAVPPAPDFGSRGTTYGPNGNDLHFAGPDGISGTAASGSLDGYAEANKVGSITTSQWSGGVATVNPRVGIPLPEQLGGDWHIDQAQVTISNLYDEVDLLAWPAAATYPNEREDIVDGGSNPLVAHAQPQDFTIYDYTTATQEMVTNPTLSGTAGQYYPTGWNLQSSSYPDSTWNNNGGYLKYWEGYMNEAGTDCSSSWTVHQSSTCSYHPSCSGWFDLLSTDPDFRGVPSDNAGYMYSNAIVVRGYANQGGGSTHEYCEKRASTSYLADLEYEGGIYNGISQDFSNDEILSANLYGQLYIDLPSGSRSSSHPVAPNYPYNRETWSHYECGDGRDSGYSASPSWMVTAWMVVQAPNGATAQTNVHTFTTAGTKTISTVDLADFVNANKDTGTDWRVIFYFKIYVKVQANAFAVSRDGPGGCGNGAWVELHSELCVRVELQQAHWQVRRSLPFPQSSDTSPGAFGYTATRDNKGRVIDSNTYPYVEFDYNVDTQLNKEQNDISGIYITAFIRLYNGGWTNWRRITSTDYSLEVLLNNDPDGLGTGARIYFTAADRSWFSGAGQYQFGIGLSVYGSTVVTPRTTGDYWVTLTNVEFQVRGSPCPTDINLDWKFGGYTEQINDGTCGVEGTTGTATMLDTETSNFAAYTADSGNYYLDFTFLADSTTRPEFDWEINVSISITDLAIPVTYSVSGSSWRSTFTATRQITNPSALEVDTSYLSTSYLELSVPRWTDGADPEVYWNFTSLQINTINEFAGLEVTDMNDPAWVGKYGGLVGIIENYTATSQLVVMRPEMLLGFFQWDLRFNFWAPNDVSGGVSYLSRDSGFSTFDTAFWANDNCYANATFNRTLSSTNVGAVWYDPLGGEIQQAWKVVNGFDYVRFDAAGEYWDADGLHGQGAGFVNVIQTNRSGLSGFSGIYRVGFGRREFYLTKPTRITGMTVSIPLYDTNGVLSSNSTPIRISLTWEDISDIGNPVPIEFDDGIGVPIQARIVVSEWTITGTTPPRKYATAYVQDGWRGWSTGGTKMFGEDSRDETAGPGEFYIYVNPKSFYKTNGNMTQGYHNFTVRLQREGFESQEWSGDFNIIVDTFAEYIGAISHDNSNPDSPHNMAEGAEASKPVAFDVQIKQRTGSMSQLSNHTGTSFVGGKIHLNYTLVKIGHFNPSDDLGALNGGELYWDFSTNRWTPNANWSLVNTTFIASRGINSKYNYHNGSLHETGDTRSTFRFNVTFPLYKDNAAGFGNNVGPGNPSLDILDVGGSPWGVEKWFYYNITYWIETNSTMEVAPDGTVHNSFQPNVYGSPAVTKVGDTWVNGSCERPQNYGGAESWRYGNPDYVGTYQDDVPYDGRKREEWVRVNLHHELTGNITSLVLVNASERIKFPSRVRSPHWTQTNASDAGWAFNNTNAYFDDYLDQGYDPLEPPGHQNRQYGDPPYYRAAQYWMNLTKYGYETHNQYPQLIRFRVLYNCTWSEKFGSLGNYGSQDGAVCGPLKAVKQYDFDGPADIRLTNWNSSSIPLTPDPAGNFTMVVPDDRFGGTRLVTGDTWVTPWLNITEKAAGTYEGQNALIITASKQGFYDAIIHIDLEIIPQKTTLANATEIPGGGVNNSVIVDDNGVNVGGKFVVTTPWNNSASFRVNFTDTTNSGGPWNRLNASVPIDNATIRIPSAAYDDTAGSYFYYDNDGTEYWTYTSLGGGVYQIDFLDTGFVQLGQEPRSYNFTFQISKANYQTRQFNVTLVIDLRKVTVNLLNATVLSGLHLDPVEYPLWDWTDPYYQELNITFEILDRDGNYAPINLTEYLTEGETEITYLDFGSFTVGDQVFVGTSPSGHPTYTVTVYTGIDVGWYTFPIGTVGIQNYADQTNTTLGVEIRPVRTQFVDLGGPGVPTYYYVYPSQSLSDLFPTFYVEILDLDHSERLGPFINDSISLVDVSDVATNWSMDWSFSLYSFEKPSGEKYNRRVYKVTFNITGLPARADPYQVQFNMTKANHEPVNEILQFYVTPAPTEFYDLKLNDQVIYDDGTVRYTTSPIQIPWGQPLNLSFGWGYKDRQGRSWALINETEAPVLFYLENWFPYKNESATFHGASATRGDYSILLYTDVTTVNVPYQFQFNLTAYKGNVSAGVLNFSAKTYTFDILLRARLTSLVVMEDIDKGYVSTDTTRTIAYADELSLGFELVDAEVDTALIDEATVKSVTGISIDGHMAGESFTWSKGGLQMAAEIKSSPRVHGGRQHFYYNLTFLDTSNMSASETPYEITITVSRTFYLSQTITFYVTVTQKEVYAIYSTDSEVHPVIVIKDVEGEGGENLVQNFELRLQVYDPDTNEPFDHDEFVVYYQFKFYNSTSGLYEDATFEHASGNLTWDPANQWYSRKVPVVEGMNGGFRLFFTVVSRSGNYATSTFTGSIVFQNPTPAWDPITYVIIAISVGLIVAVGGYGTRLLWLRRIPYVLRMIDETVEKIKRDKYPPVGVMTGRREFVVNTVIEQLAGVGIKWEMAKKLIEEEEEEEGIGEEEEVGAPLSVDEINERLDKIKGLTAEEKMLFSDELRRLDRKEQEEFLESLKEDTTKK